MMLVSKILDGDTSLEYSAKLAVAALVKAHSPTRAQVNSACNIFNFARYDTTPPSNLQALEESKGGSHTADAKLREPRQSFFSAALFDLGMTPNTMQVTPRERVNRDNYLESRIKLLKSHKEGGAEFAAQQMPSTSSTAMTPSPMKQHDCTPHGAIMPFTTEKHITDVRRQKSMGSQFDDEQDESGSEDRPDDFYSGDSSSVMKTPKYRLNDLRR